MRIGFIGLGAMGTPMASRLLRMGNTLMVHDAREASAEPLVAAGAQWGTTAEAVAGESDVIMTSLPGPAEVEAVALGPRGIRDGAKAGSLYIDLSTNSPTTMRTIHAAFGERGVQVSDAPLSGGVTGAANGTLQLMVGGDEAVFPRVEEAVRPLGHASYMGPVGAGAIAKLVHNMISIVAIQLLAEGFTLGVKAGISPDSLLEAVQGGGYGQGMHLSHLIKNMILEGELGATGFSLALARKDLELATDLAREFDVPVPITTLGEQFLVQAVVRGLQTAGSSAAWVLQEEAAGVEVRRS
jgi:3-hydroxyisobutyrate dehydrogenase-like beta-hydroxyacid dehydrogenase